LKKKIGVFRLNAEKVQLFFGNRGRIADLGRCNGPDRCTLGFLFVSMVLANRSCFFASPIHEKMAIKKSYFQVLDYDVSKGGNSLKNKGGSKKSKSDKEKIRQSKANLQKRKYERKQKTSSWAKLKIRDEDGWNDAMRSKYYSLNAVLKRYILENDMTVIENRPKRLDGTPMTKKEVKVKNNYARGIWNDGDVSTVIKLADNLARFIVKSDEEKKENGFFKQNPKAKPVEKPSQINQHHLTEFITAKLDSGAVAPSSAREYVVKLQKVFESTSRGPKGIKSHNSLMKKCSGEGPIVKIVQKRAKELGYKEGATRSKEHAIRNVGKTDGEKGYSLIQARSIIEHSKEDPMISLAARVFTYVGTRVGALEHMTWVDVMDDEGKVKPYLDFFHEGQMKGGRQQVAEVNEAKEALERIYREGDFTQSDSVFGDVSKYKLEKGIRQACDSAGIDYKGNHGFRDATNEYYETEKVPQMLKGLSKNEKKELLAKSILPMVNIEVIKKDGTVHKPHNPPVNKTEKQYEYKKNKDGTLAQDKLGRRIPVMKMKKGKNGNMVPVEKVIIGKDGQPEIEEKYTYEKLMKKPVKTLTQLYIAQQISHNRADANAPYQSWKRRNKDQ
jgi:hypothetical protein